MPEPAAFSGLGEEATEHRFGIWSVFWRRDDFLIPDIGAFDFRRLVLPVGVVVSDGPADVGFAIVKLESGVGFEILHGAHRQDLEAFRRRVSREVFARLRVAVSRICSDCARDAGLEAQRGTGRPCLGCRQAYCANPACLRRLTVEFLRDGTPVCGICGTGTAD